MSEALEIIPHSNGLDYWLISPLHSTAEIRIFLINSLGIELVNTFNYGSLLYDLQAIRYSPTSHRLAMGSFRENDPVKFGDFDPSTGTFSNFDNVPGTPIGSSANQYAGIIDVEWSPDGSKLYISKYRGFSPSTGGALYQYDLNSPEEPITLIQSVSSNQSNVSKGLRLGPDGIIYWLCFDSSSNGYSYIAGILDPDFAGMACNLQMQYVNIGTQLNATGLFPNFLNINNNPPVLISEPVINAMICSNNQYSYDVSQYFVDPENDGVSIVSASSTNLTITLENNNILIDGMVPFTSYDFELVVKDDYCYPAYDTVQFQVLTESFNDPDIPQVISDSIIVCAGMAAIIGNPDFPQELYWNNDMIGQTIEVFQGGQYICEFLWIDGCTYSDTINVVFEDPIEAINETEILLCDQTSVSLQTSIVDANYLWSTGESSSSIVVTQPGYYSITVTDSIGCINIDSVLVNLNAQLIFQINNNQDTLVLCNGASAVLGIELQEDIDCVWSTGESGMSITVDEAGIYSVESSNVCGLLNDQITVLINQSPIVQIEDDFEQCSEIDSTLSSTYILSNYLWSDGTSNATLQINSSGNFWLQSTNECGTSIDSISVSIIPLPTIQSMNPLNPVICDDDFLMLAVTPNNADFFQWTTGDSTNEITITSPGIYIATATNECGTSTISFDVSADQTPIVTVGEDIVLCPDNDTTITGFSSTGSFLWSTGDTSASLQINSEGTFWLLSENECGSASDSLTVTFEDIEDIFENASISVCGSESIELASDIIAQEYEWSTGDNTSSITVSNDGVYTLQIITFNLCIVYDEILVEFPQYPQPVFTIEHSECGITLHSPISPLAILWSTGETTDSISIDQSGYYELTMYYDDNCFETYGEYVEVTESRIPEYFIPNIFTPNGDATNEFFQLIPDAVLCVKNFNLSMFNRWGQKIFETENQNFKWNGNLENGSSIIDGTYYCIVQFEQNGQHHSHNVAVHVIRDE